MAIDRLTLIVPGHLDQPTGGYRYDARVAAELRRLGYGVDIVELAGRFPEPDQQARAALEDALRALPDRHLAVIDGLALGGLPEVAHRHSERLALVALVHHPLADETGLSPERRERLMASETRALAACQRILTTSAFTASRLADFGVQADQVRVVPPGVDRAHKGARGDSRDPKTQKLLCVGSLVPRKGQDLLVSALAGLEDFPWRLDCVGDSDRDRAFADTVNASISRHGLAQRIRLRGVQDQDTLDATYRNADLLLVPSHYEGYGMVVTEALARALPMIATTGGALVDTVPREAALQVPPGNAEALARALRRWFNEPGLRAEKRAGAAEAGCSLEDWTTTGHRFAKALDLDIKPISA